MLDLFIIATVAAYIYDYKKDKKNYGSKGNGTLYLVVIAAVAFLVLKRIFF